MNLCALGAGGGRPSTPRIDDGAVPSQAAAAVLPERESGRYAAFGNPVGQDATRGRPPRRRLRIGPRSAEP